MRVFNIYGALFSVSFPEDLGGLCLGLLFLDTFKSLSVISMNLKP